MRESDCGKSLRFQILKLYEKNQDENIRHTPKFYPVKRVNHQTTVSVFFKIRHPSKMAFVWSFLDPKVAQSQSPDDSGSLEVVQNKQKTT